MRKNRNEILKSPIIDARRLHSHSSKHNLKNVTVPEFQQALARWWQNLKNARNVTVPASKPEFTCHHRNLKTSESLTVTKSLQSPKQTR